MNELEKLSKLKLKMPKGIKQYIFNNTDYKERRTVVSRYVQTIEVWHGRLLLRTFAFRSKTKKNRYSDMLIMEVQRQLEGYTKCCQRNVYSVLGNKTVSYKETDYYYSDNFYLYKAWYFNAYKMYSKKEVIDALGLQYCQYKNPLNKSNLDFFNYICLYRKEPKIELLVKAGLSQYLTGLRYLDLSKKKLFEIFKTEQKHEKYLKKLGGINHILILREYSKYINCLEDINVIYDIKRNKHENVLKVLCNKSIQYYANLSYGNCIQYNDYIGFLLKCNIPITNKMLSPKNLAKNHDKYQKLVEITKNELVNRGILEVYYKNLKYVYSNGAYTILPVESGEDLDKESEVLNHCVHQYKERLSNTETNIMLIRKNDDITTPFVTLEFKGDKVIQARGYKNNVGNPLEISVKNFINDWCKKFKKKSCFKEVM